MRRQMDDVFGRALGDERAGPPAAAWSPVTEITSSDDGWTLRVALPRIDPKDVHIELSGTSLTILRPTRPWAQAAPVPAAVL